MGIIHYETNAVTLTQLWDKPYINLLSTILHLYSIVYNSVQYNIVLIHTYCIHTLVAANTTILCQFN